MTALSDIMDALRCAPPIPPGHMRVVKVGAAAARAICCEYERGEEPTKILHYPLIRTDEFKGWDIVDVPPNEKGKKWPTLR
jgi:hypothetical protein